MRHPLFGLSVAGYRSEGGYNGLGEPANQWSVWERAGKAPPGSGPELWAHPERALDRAASAGAEAISLSVEWARVEPAPERPDDEALDHYARILTGCAERAMTPIVVLHDVAIPEWLGEEFWLTPGSPERFCDHVTRVVSHLGPVCRRWVTTRQANTVALSGWVGGHHPPRRIAALSDAWAVVDNLLTAHVLAYEAIHDVQAGPSEQAGPEVTIGLGVTSSYDWHRLLVDLLCAPSLGVERDALDAWVDERRGVHDASTPPHGLVGVVARRFASATSPFGGERGGGATLARGAAEVSPRRLSLRRASPRRAVEAAYAFAARHASGGPARPLDALLVGWRPPGSASAAAPDMPDVIARGIGRSSRAAGAAPWEVRPDPGALTAWCEGQEELTPGLPLWIEDSFATRGREARADGWDRPAYVRAEVAALAHAAASGVPVAGYLYHALAGRTEPTWPDADVGLLRLDVLGGTGEGSGLGGAVAGADIDGDVGATTLDGEMYRRLITTLRP